MGQAHDPSRRLLGCSDKETGHWVPVSECGAALAFLDLHGPVAYPIFDDKEGTVDGLAD